MEKHKKMKACADFDKIVDKHGKLCLDFNRLEKACKKYNTSKDDENVLQSKNRQE